jgi:hypothetical protein
MSCVSLLEDQQDRRDESGVTGTERPQTQNVFEIINRRREPAPRRSISEKQKEELRQRRIARENAQRAWREESNLIYIVEENVILDFKKGTVRPIDPRRPVSSRWGAAG